IQIEFVVERFDGLGVDIVVELLALGDRVDHVDAFAVELVGDLLDRTPDDRKMEVAPGGVGEFAAHGGEFETHVAEFAATVFGDGEHTHASTPLSRRRSPNSLAVSSGLPSKTVASL